MAQGILITLIVIDLIISLSLHGAPRTLNRHNFWLVLLDKIILLTLLKWGGFFN